MNIWVKKSIILANSKGYLDKLLEIYPVGLAEKREIDDELDSNIRKAFEEKNYKNLISELLKLKKFPIDDQYVATLRKHKSLINKNPKQLNVYVKGYYL